MKPLTPTDYFSDYVGALQRIRGCSFNEAFAEMSSLPEGTAYYTYLDKVSRELRENRKIDTEELPDLIEKLRTQILFNIKDGDGERCAVFLAAGIYRAQTLVMARNRGRVAA